MLYLSQRREKCALTTFARQEMQMKSQPGGKAPTSPEMSQGGVQSETPKVSRRTFLKSAAGLAASVNFQHLWRGSTGDFLLSFGAGWLGLLLGGAEKFRLGTPRVYG